MKQLRMVLGTTLALFCVLAASHAAEAGEQSKASLVQRAKEYDRLLVTPPHTSSEQHHLIAVTLAAHETQNTDPGEIASALDLLGSVVTYLVQSDTDFTWDGLDWIRSSRTTYSYSGTKLTESITQDYDDTLFTWVNSYRLTVTYDGSGRLSTMTGYIWGGTVWVNSGLTTFTYDGSGNLINTLFQMWSGTAWTNFTKSTMTYTGSLLATAISQMWAGTDWLNTRKNIYTYSGGHLAEDLSQAWTGAWIDAERITYTYDGNGRNTLALSQRWAGAGPWTNWTKDEYTYDGATTNEILDKNFSWNGASWDAVRADTTRYSSGRPIEVVTYYFLFGSLKRTLYTYDGSGNLIEDVDQNGTGVSWQNDLRSVHVYIVAGIFDNDAAAGILANFEIGQNYPNPFNQNTIIPYSLASDSRVQIRVSNLLGQTVATLVDGYQSTGSHSVAWDGLDMNGRVVASGLYFLRVQVGGVAQVRKMVLLK